MPRFIFIDALFVGFGLRFSVVDACAIINDAEVVKKAAAAVG